LRESLGKDVKISFVQLPSEAVRMLDGIHFDIVFIDINMAEMNGFKLWSILKEVHADTKYILMSGSPLTEEQNRLFSDNFISKPFDDGEVVAFVKCV